MKPTRKELIEKVEVYETMLHDIQMCSAVTMDMPAISHIIDVINSWSYSHRAGNGELTEKEQEQQVRKQFERMKNREWSASIWNSGIDTTYKKRTKT